MLLRNVTGRASGPVGLGLRPGRAGRGPAAAGGTAPSARPVDDWRVQRREDRSGIFLRRAAQSLTVLTTNRTRTFPVERVWSTGLVVALELVDTRVATPLTYYMVHGSLLYLYWPIGVCHAIYEVRACGRSWDLLFVHIEAPDDYARVAASHIEGAAGTKANRAYRIANVRAQRVQEHV